MRMGRGIGLGGMLACWLENGATLAFTLRNKLNVVADFRVQGEGEEEVGARGAAETILGNPAEEDIQAEAVVFLGVEVADLTVVVAEGFPEAVVLTGAEAEVFPGVVGLTGVVAEVTPAASAEGVEIGRVIGVDMGEEVVSSQTITSLSPALQRRRQIKRLFLTNALYLQSQWVHMV